MPATSTGDFAKHYYPEYAQQAAGPDSLWIGPRRLQRAIIKHVYGGKSSTSVMP
jgi:hypothetical protein